MTVGNYGKYEQDCDCGCGRPIYSTSASPWFFSDHCQARWMANNVDIPTTTESDEAYQAMGFCCAAGAETYPDYCHWHGRQRVNEAADFRLSAVRRRVFIALNAGTPTNEVRELQNLREALTRWASDPEAQRILRTYFFRASGG